MCMSWYGAGTKTPESQLPSAQVNLSRIHVVRWEIKESLHIFHTQLACPKLRWRCKHIQPFLPRKITKFRPHMSIHGPNRKTEVVPFLGELLPLGLFENWCVVGLGLVALACAPFWYPKTPNPWVFLGTVGNCRFWAHFFADKRHTGSLDEASKWEIPSCQVCSLVPGHSAEEKQRATMLHLVFSMKIAAVL